uniref:Uncharacterized protein n=1 Tax=Caenorhabditis japonica TaxID=281687 RepID=A0A8R1DUQ9_CAEJA
MAARKFINFLIFAAILGVCRAKFCKDIITIRDNKQDVVPAIVYLEDSKSKKAEIFCEGQTSDDVVELVTNSRSLGVLDSDQHRTAICRLGRWYALDKYNELAVVKIVGCLVHQ